MNVAKTNQKGFSIIEVVLVLAIAGLIFLMVFVALPALQRSQRDTGRRNDVGVVASAVSTYASNNKGALPAASAAGSTALRGYVDSLNQYDVTQIVVNGAVTTAPGDNIVVHPRAKCGTNGNATTTGAKARQAAIRVQLEGSNVVYCQDV